VAERGFGMEWMLASRHLTSKSGGPISVTATVAVVGVALGVASLVVVTAVMSGYQRDIRDRILSTNAHLVIQKYGIDFDSYRETMARAIKVPGVLAASPFTFNEVLIASGDHAVGVLLKGVDPVTAPHVTAIEENLCMDYDATGICHHGSAVASRGELQRLLNPTAAVPTIIVGAELLKKLGQQVGADVILTTPVGIAGARGNAPKRLPFRIAGVFRSGMYDFDARLAYSELGASQRLLGIGDTANGVELRIDDPERVESLTPKVLRAVGRYPYHAIDWRELNEGIFTALKLQKIVMFLVLAFIVVVAAFNIASTLFMAVVEKIGDIGVLKSMGAHDVSVMKVFVIEGWLVGSLGTALGVLLGLTIAFLIGRMKISIAADVYMVGTLSVRILPIEIGVTAFSALAISHLATIYPALKAARARPVDAMRYD